eukprot:245826-Rhodomonas_salina.1
MPPHVQGESKVSVRNNPTTGDRSLGKTEKKSFQNNPRAQGDDCMPRYPGTRVPEYRVLLGSSNFKTNNRFLAKLPGYQVQFSLCRLHPCAWYNF